MGKCKFVIATCIFTCLWSVMALAQSDPVYPSRVIRLIVSFPPGGGTDIIARTLGQRLGKELGQSIVVDNRGGAGGNIGAEIAAKATPDGHTIFIAAATHAINMTLYRKPGYDLEKDFAAVSQVAFIPYTLVSNISLPLKSVGDLVRMAKEKPGQMNYSSAGSGTGTHLAMEIFKTAAGVDIVHVPYKGSAPAVTELISGQVQVMFGNTASVLPQIKSGRLRALAVSSTQRIAVLPDVPTIAETAIPGFEVIQWYGIFAPAGTPPAFVQKLNAGITKVAQAAEFKERVFAEGGEAVHNTPQQFARFVRSEISRWAKAVHTSGAHVD
ncbi:MAG: tripartite tricarboxylate transporter substrate binding protein [Burkholderiales bacterium]|nr:tripartite tricarboxylate transporter substrate binding protein [Burkholderiales bacterium]